MKTYPRKDTKDINKEIENLSTKVNPWYIIGYIMVILGILGLLSVLPFSILSSIIALIAGICGLTQPRKVKR